MSDPSREREAARVVDLRANGLPALAPVALLVGPPFSADGIVYLRPNRLLALAPAALLASPLLFVVPLITHPDVALAHLLVAFAVSLLFLFGVMGTTWGRRSNRWPGRVTGKLVAGAEGVSLDGVRLAAREEIKSGLVVPRGLEKPVVRLDRGLRTPLELEVADETQGRALLRALGLDASHTTATFRTPSRVVTDQRHRFLFVVAIVLLAFLSGMVQQILGPFGSFFNLALIAAVATFSILTRSRLDVGADGILTSWLGLQKRFIPYREITRVTTYADTAEAILFGRRAKGGYRGVALEMADGDTLHLPVAQLAATDGPQRVGAIVERIREAMASYQRGEAGASTAALDRGERSPSEWIQSLRAVGAGAASDHRTAPVLPEQLWRIVEDPAQTPELRAGAAVVLRSSEGAEGRARLRSAASAVAEPRVRIAIEAAGSEDEAALEEALAALPREARR